MSWSHRDITKVILDQFRVTHFFIIFHQNFDPKKLTFGYWEHQFYANSGGFEARILKFMIFSSAVFKDFKF